jgi:hypothetical protein
MLRMRRRFSDDDVADVAKLALHGLVHQPVTASYISCASFGGAARRARRPLCRPASILGIVLPIRNVRLWLVQCTCPLSGV